MYIYAALLAVLLSAPVFAQSGWEHYTFEGGNTANSIRTIAEDMSGIIWIGTSEKLHFFDNGEWHSVNDLNDITEFWVWDIALNPNGEIWILVNNVGIYKLSHETWMLVKEGDYSRLGFDAHGNLWTRTRGEGYLQVFDGEAWKSYDDSCDITIKHVYAIETSDSGDIWIGTNDGIYQTHVDALDAWTIYTTEHGLPDASIDDIDIGPDGKIWAYSYDGGISYFDQGVWVLITDEDCEVDSEGVVSLEVDNYGSPWCIHVQNNLCAYINGIWETNLFEPADFIDFFANDMFIDSQDRLWIGTDGGLYCHQLEPTVVGVQEEEPQSFSLSPPTPNPFNPTTRISYTLTESSPVTLAVYNVSGQKVATLVDEPQTAGMHMATFDGTGLASGLYFARMKADGMVQTEKMVLMK